MTATVMPGVEEYVDRARSLVPLIRQRAAEAEQRGSLTEDVVDALWDSGILRICYPADIGGGGLLPPAAYRVAQEIATGDASTGWNAMFLMASPVFCSQLPRERFNEVLGPPRGSLVGATIPAARSVPVPGGFRVTGSAPYASGHALATHIMVGSLVVDAATGKTAHPPQYRICCIPTAEVRFMDNWKATGMQATGSDDVSVSDLFVPEDMSFLTPAPQPTWLGRPWASLPLFAQVGPTIASVAIGTTRNAIDSFIEVAPGKRPYGSAVQLSESSGAQLAVAEAEGLWLAAEAVLHKGTTTLWGIAGDRQPTPLELARSRLASVTAVQLCQRAMELLHRWSGMTACLEGNTLERTFRDMATISQHVTIQPGRFEPAGRVLMGLDTPIGFL
jgi:alkylation response protein AidB-like acyl-CoA dehydrogenase